MEKILTKQLNNASIYAMLKQALAKKIGDSAAFEAKQLLGFVAQLPATMALLSSTLLTTEQKAQLQTLCDLRLTGVPVQYLVGQWSFYGYDFFVGEGVLIPRADTEVLCEVALSLLNNIKNPRILDLCSGSGCVAIALQKERPDSIVIAIEKSSEAMHYLQKNIAFHHANVVAVLDDVLCPQINSNRFDAIVCNPPYLSDQDMIELQLEVTFEPQQALQASNDGFLFYERIPTLWKRSLKTGGVLVFEVGFRQADHVADLLHQQGYINVQIQKDLAGVKRVVFGVKP